MDSDIRARKIEGTIDYLDARISQERLAQEDRGYPVVMRVFGVLVILAGLSNVITYATSVLAADHATLFGQALSQYSLATIVIFVVYMALLGGEAFAQIVLGVRLLRNQHRGVAVACAFLAMAQTAGMLCTTMLTGLSVDLVPQGISIAVLAMLGSYADPTLRQERVEQRLRRELADKHAQEEGTLGLDTTGKGFIELNFFNIFWVFVVCCVLGLLIEMVYHFLMVGEFQDRAGLLYGPFSPIYGFGAMLMTVALNRFHKANPLAVFMVAGLIGAVFEYLVSWWMEFSFGIEAWDYTGTFLNVGGRTNFKFFCMWGALGLMWLRWLLPWLLELINRIPWNWRYLVTAIATALMVVDGALTVASLDCWYQRQSGAMEHMTQTWIDRFCNDNYDDEFMEQRFQTMSLDPDSATRVS